MAKSKKRGSPRKKGSAGKDNKSVFVSDKPLPFSIKETDDHPAISGTYVPIGVLQFAEELKKVNSATDAGMVSITLDVIYAHLKSWDIPDELSRANLSRLKTAAWKALLKVITGGEDIRRGN